LPRELAGGATWHGFRPEGERFRELVTVNLETDRDGCIADAKLCLDRAFIEHAKEGALARDPGTTGSGSASSVPDRGDAASAPACMGHPGLIRLISQGETATIPPIEGSRSRTMGRVMRDAGLHALSGRFPITPSSCGLWPAAAWTRRRGRHQEHSFGPGNCDTETEYCSRGRARY
jgi:hypothetical protein